MVGVSIQPGLHSFKLHPSLLSAGDYKFALRCVKRYFENFFVALDKCQSLLKIWKIINFLMASYSIDQVLAVQKNPVLGVLPVGRTKMFVL